MAHPLARILGFTAAMLFMSTLARADCTKDTDCKGVRVCTAGACVDPVSPPIVRAMPDDDAAQPAPVPPPPVVQQAPRQVQTPAKQEGQPVSRTRAVRAAPQRTSTSTSTSATGIGLFAFGLLLDATGGGMYFGGARAKCDLGKRDCDTVAKAGIGVLILGGVLTVVGLSVWVVGSSQDVAVRKPRLLPYLSVCLSGGEAGFQF